jgi:hypothetical protein
VRRSWHSSLGFAAAVLLVAALQAPNYRVSYRLRVLQPGAGEGGAGGADTQLLASGVVTGPPETNMRLSLSAPGAELRGLLATLPEPDTVNLAALFFSRRAAGRSRRGLPLWEEDSYRRWTRLPWGGTARLYPFGPPGAGVPTRLRLGRSARPPIWVEITVGRQFAAGETRASEEVTIVDSAVAFDAQAVVPPRRVTVRMSLVRGDTASSLRTVDFVPEAPGRRVSFVLGGETFDFDVTLERPEPPRTGRDSALAVDADVVCLRLLVPGSSGPARVRCGRLDNVARRLALVDGDTLVATFAWPAVR